MYRILILLSGLLVVSPSWASSLDLNIHSHAFRATYANYVGRKAVTDFGVLLIRERPVDENDTLLHAGLNFVFQNIRLGMRAIYVAPGNSDILSLGFGGQARFALSNRIGIGGQIYYAPELTSAMDSAGYQEFGVRLDFKVNRDVYIYLGYRNIKVKIQQVYNKLQLDDDLHLGIKLYF